MLWPENRNQGESDIQSQTIWKVKLLNEYEIELTTLAITQIFNSYLIHVDPVF